MQATPSPSALAASEEVSRAPVCQGGRTHGVYAPACEEDASDAVHGSVGFNPMLQAPGAMTDAAASGAFGTSLRRWGRLYRLLHPIFYNC